MFILYIHLIYVYEDQFHILRIAKTIPNVVSWEGHRRLIFWYSCQSLALFDESGGKIKKKIKHLDVGMSPPAFSFKLIVTLTFDPDLVLFVTFDLDPFPEI